MDKAKIQEELTEFHIMALYDFMCPIDYGHIADQISSRQEAAIRRYRNDSLFNAQVSSLVAYTIRIIENNIPPHVG